MVSVWRLYRRYIYKMQLHGLGAIHLGVTNLPVCLAWVSRSWNPVLKLGNLQKSRTGKYVSTYACMYMCVYVSKAMVVDELQGIQILQSIKQLWIQCLDWYLSVLLGRKPWAPVFSLLQITFSLSWRN